MTAESSQAIRPEDFWHPDAGDTGKLPGYKLHSWLSEEGLLTERLRGMYGDDFSLRLLNSSARPVEGETHIRQILLCREDEPVIYAVTEIPAQAIADYPWLVELGEQPIGEALRDRGGFDRSEFSYGLVEPTELPDTLLAAAGNDALWARHYVFTVGGHELPVTEVFLPALTGRHGRTT